MNNHYDYIIAGAGAAGLSLAIYMIDEGITKQKKILLIDKDAKTANDRTWSFWQKESGRFESIIHKQWPSIQVFSTDFHKKESIAPYAYKMIRGADFYNYCLNKIKEDGNIVYLTASIKSITSMENNAVVVANGIEYNCTYCFSSILLNQPRLTTKNNYLLQHFKGQIIQTATPSFDVAVATYMDFRVSQQYGTTFGYVLPFSATEALVEYTLFTPELLTNEQYNEGLTNYIKQYLAITSYTVKEEEQGIIPMTDYSFTKTDNQIIYIGTAGGNTRGSSGYTFKFIQQQCSAIAQRLKNGQSPIVASSIKQKSKFYDSVLLEVLAKNKVTGQNVFTNIFKKNKLVNVLPFLDDESTLWNDLGIILSQPIIPFAKAALKKLF